MRLNGFIRERAQPRTNVFLIHHQPPHIHTLFIAQRLHSLAVWGLSNTQFGSFLKGHLLYWESSLWSGHGELHTPTQNDTQTNLHEGDASCCPVFTNFWHCLVKECGTVSDDGIVARTPVHHCHQAYSAKRHQAWPLPCQVLPAVCLSEGREIFLIIMLKVLITCLLIQWLIIPPIMALEH